MDAVRTRQKSASSGSLHLSYRSHGRQNAGYATVRPQSRRRPLRSVNENVTLLRSPGPLESMLKTTTETGDIGIFSIKAGGLPSNHRHHRPSRRAPHDTFLPVSHHGKPPAGKLPQGEGPHHRSYRDTTSKIISLYGGDHQRYWLGSASPAFDDGYRAYSLNTCSSRQVSSRKSSATLRSGSGSGSGSGGSSSQRPRSPFPYPTRLKRMGVRPASPAMAENGGIDYSRMVELDRISKRTIHGSYRPSYAHTARRPPPLSLRLDGSRSTASLPSRASPGPCHFELSPVPGPVPTPSSSLSDMPRAYQGNKQGSSTDQSVRSASLTSIVDMYQRPLTASSTVPALRPAGSFYYDYSEEFEKPSPYFAKAEPQIPIYPLPHGSGPNGRPLVQQNDAPTVVEINPTAQDTAHAVGEGYGKPAPIQTLCSSVDRRDSSDNSPRSIDNVLDMAMSHSGPRELPPECEELDVLAADLATRWDAQPRLVASSSEPRAMSTEIRASPMNAMQQTKNNSTVEATPCISHTPADSQEPLELKSDRRASRSSLNKLRCTLDPALSDFASLFSSFERLTKPSCSHGEDGGISDDDCCPLRQADDEAETHSDNGGDYGFPRRLGRRPSLDLFNKLAAESDARKRRHRRNAAAFRINPIGFWENLETNRPEISSPRGETNILSPAPISPVRQLRVKDSIPQLMKALPPLPDEAVIACDEEYVGKPEAAEGVDSHAPGSGCPMPVESDTQGTEAPPPSPVRRSMALQVRSPDRPLLFGAGSSPSDVSGPQIHCKHPDNEQTSVIRHKASKGIYPRLRLKLSRSRLRRSRSGVGGQALGNNRLKQCNSLADLAPSSHRDADIEKCPGQDRVRRRSKSSASLSVRAQREGRPDMMGTSPQGSDQFNIPYPPSLNDAEAPDRRSYSARRTSGQRPRVCMDAQSAVEHRGLRHKLSLFRLRITGGAGSEGRKEMDCAAMDDAKGQSMDELHRGRAHSTRSEKRGGRMRR